MSLPEGAERQRVTTSPETEENVGGMTLSPPAFQLFADGDAGGGSNGGANGSAPIQRQVSSPAAQLVGEYAEFPGAIEQILGGTAETASEGGAGHPGTYFDHVPANCYTTLWDIYKALHWRSAYHRSARDWAQAAISGMQALRAELAANGVLPNPLIARVTTALSPILNPSSGSAGGNSMAAVLAGAIDNNRIVGPLPRSAAEHETYAAQLQAGLVGAANLLSTELVATVPDQIVNASSPYNYLYYRSLDALTGGQRNGLTAIYRARWEATRPATRRQKIDYASTALTRLLDAARQRRMLQNLTGLDAAGIEAQVVAIQAAITLYVTGRMTAIRADETMTHIARNGQAIPPAERRTGGGGRRRAAAPITYEEGTVTTPWDPQGDYTVEQARADLGDEPHMTLHGQNIGPYSSGGKKYPFVYGSREYSIITRTTGRRFFGIKYGGISSMTLSAVDQLRNSTDPIYFNEAQRHIVDSVRPHVQSEGGISSINTWDSQNITIAGRGEASGRISIMIRAAQRMMEHHNTPVPQLARVQQLVDQLAADSDEGMAGVRFNMPLIHELVDLLETPEVHRALTLAKLNDAIVGFFGEAFEVRGEATLYNEDVDARDEARLLTEMSANHLHPVIMGIAIHNRLGGSGFSNPMEYAMRANREFPQRSMYLNAGQPDYEQLSKQVAYLGKIRVQNKRRASRGTASIAQTSLTIIFSQKIADFNNYFSNAGAEMENGAYFNMAAATTVLPFWTGERTFTASTTRPGADRLIISSGEGASTRYYDCGPLLGADVTDAERDTPAPEDSTLEDEGGETVE